MFKEEEDRYFKILHTGKFWDAERFALSCWIFNNSSDTKCVIDSWFQISDVIGSFISCFRHPVLLIPINSKIRSISNWFNPFQKHRWWCDIIHCEICDHFWLWVWREKQIICAGERGNLNRCKNNSIMNL